MNFYFEAATVLDRLDEKKGSIKGMLGALPAQNRKRTTALVLESLKYKSALKEILDASGVLQLEKRVFDSARASPQNIALLLLHDLLFAKGGIQAGDGPLKQAILRHKTRLNAELVKIKIKRGAQSKENLVQQSDPRASKIPRYARVNTLKTTLSAAVIDLTSRGYTDGDEAKGTVFTYDKHVPNLLLFDSNRSLHLDPAYERGELILQDKASCLPPLVLQPPSHDKACVIDATAAPGNKTTLLSALMRNKGKLFALERDKRRFKTLQMMLEKAGATNVEARNEDFTSLDPTAPEFAHVTHILLDPSCSGSGIVNRLDYLLDDNDENDATDDDRLERLASFQLAMIKHALQFPAAQRIVYSTCSVHAVENERVVRAALEAAGDSWTLARREDVLPTWSRRGLQEELGPDEDATSLIRCMPGEDETNGFFVSCFVRRSSLSAVGQKRNATEAADSAGPKKKKRRKNKKKKKKGANQENAPVQVESVENDSD
ncbi:S-adenosyl-L-methionine-dependent methyltransferase [Auriculariales sp. MPI-PUGE-AT-0066]|nr:S-adenosyl-L-methionine-dependent methyltransferase [Auriculariales sp. MPI-PUGE-AT-0066]